MQEKNSGKRAERRSDSRRQQDKENAKELKLLRDKMEMIKKDVERLERIKPLASVASSVVHDVRNSLGIISSTAQFVLNKLNPPLQMKQSWETVLRNVETIQKILKAYLGIARQAETKQSIEFNEIIERVCHFLDIQFRNKNIKLEKKLDHSLPTFMADMSAIESAILNISLNAFDAMENGGALKFTTKTDTIKGKVIVEIEDTGCGIPDEHLDKIFSPFFTTKETGTGMGLYSVKATIENNDGKISCESKMGVGTKMIISFPTV